MIKETMVISTITLARSPKEGRRILQSLNVLAKKKASSIVVVDGGSPREFISELKTIPHIHLLIQRNGGLQNQTIASLRNAAINNPKAIFYTESDKMEFFEVMGDRFFDNTEKIIQRDPNFGMIIPSRTAESFSHVPNFQKYIENAENTLLRKLIHDSNQHNDYAYGPRMISPDLIPYLDVLTADIGWGWMHFLFLIAHKLEKKIYTVPLNIPIFGAGEERDDKQITYRLKQFRNFIDAILQANSSEISSL